MKLEKFISKYTPEYVLKNGAPSAEDMKAYEGEHPFDVRGILQEFYLQIELTQACPAYREWLLFHAGISGLTYFTYVDSSEQIFYLRLCAALRLAGWESCLEYVNIPSIDGGYLSGVRVAAVLTDSFNKLIEKNTSEEPCSAEPHDVWEVVYATFKKLVCCSPDARDCIDYGEYCKAMTTFLRNPQDVHPHGEVEGRFISGRLLEVLESMDTAPRDYIWEVLHRALVGHKASCG
tara:strand:- start:13 stop:714 length:702 start_codon:yes stop_codon:yes gene_type:complete